jgi:predicted Zn-dependent protease
VADDLGRATREIARGTGTNSSDADRLGDATRVVVNTAGQNWDPQDIGETFAVSLTHDPGLVEDVSINTYVTNVGITIASVVGHPELDFTFGVLQDGQVNAVSGPGGFIFITRGALQRMQDESELAAVLAHEIAHVVKEHSWKTIRSKRGVNFTRDLTAAVSGEQWVHAVGGIISDLRDMTFNPEQESEADRLAVQYLSQANYDPTALARFLSREMTKGPVDMRSHPPTENRLRVLETLTRSLPSGQKNAERFLKTMKSSSVITP